MAKVREGTRNLIYW